MEKGREKEYLYLLLSDALIDIRAEAYESGDKKVHWISNFYHNLPSALLYSEKTHAEILDNLREHAKHDDMEGWLENRIKGADQIIRFREKNKD